MPSYKSIYRILASLVIFTFIFIIPFGTSNPVGARSISEIGMINDASTRSIFDLPENTSPAAPITPENFITSTSSQPASLGSPDPTRPIPPSLEDQIRFQNELKAQTSSDPLIEQLPPALEPDRIQQTDKAMIGMPGQNPTSSTHPGEMTTLGTSGIQGVTLPEYMIVRGSLVDASGAAQIETIIRAESNSSGFYTETLTDSQGRFVFLHLPTDDYRLLTRSSAGLLSLAEPESSNVSSHEALAPQTHALTLLEEAVAGLEQPARLPSHPFAMKPETLPAETLLGTGRITGMVTKTGGTLLENALVQLYTSTYSWVNSTYTDELGYYEFSGLDANDYIVSFVCDPTCDPEYLADEFYNDKYSIESADLVPVVDGGTTTGINAILEPSGRISGTVTSAINFSPMPGVDVCAENLDQSLQLCGLTDSEGGYTLPYLPSDTYTVYFYPYNGYSPLYYNQKSTREAADPVTVVQGQVTPNIDAQLGPSQYITGRVTSEVDGTPIYSMIYAIPISGGYFSNTWTDAGGYYNLAGMEPGFYRIQFLPQDLCDESGCQPTEYLSEYYNGKSVYALGDVLAVTADSMHTNIDATLQKGAFITGNVKASDGTTPLENVNIQLYNQEGSSFWAAQTDVDGNYRTTPLQPGTYRIEFNTGSCSSPCADHLSEFYNNAFILANAAPVVVPAQTTVSGIDAGLSLGGRISGTVIDAVTLDPIQDVLVYASSSSIYKYAYTDVNGDYSISALPTGQFTVNFSPPSPYIGEYYNDQYYFGAADLVEVIAPNEVTGIDAGLSAGGGISGIVTDESSDALLSNINVYVHSPVFDAHAYTDINGVYTFSDLPESTYTVAFYPNDGTHVSEYYNNKFSSAEADPVVVTPNNTTSGINAALSTGGEISGTVTSLAGGAPLEQVGVILMDSDKWWIGSQKTDSLGEFHFTGLNSGTYYIQFDTDYECSSGCMNSEYISEVYNDRTTLTEADPITVTVGQLTSGIDATLSTGGSISGTMTGDTGSCAPSNSYANLYDSGNTYLQYASPNELGDYSFGGLPTGVYKIHFICPGFVSEWYNDKYNFTEGLPISVTAGLETSGINVVLAAAGGISGVVTSESGGLGLSNVYVTVSNGGTSTGTWTNSSGEYSFSSLAAGSYTVNFSPNDGIHIGEFYDNKSTSAQADLVTVTPPAVTGNINAVLAVGGSISGTVTAEDGGLPLASIAVNISNDSFYQYGYTNAEGSYTIGGIPGGTYRIAFYTWDNSAYASEYYNDKKSYSEADLVTITPPGALTGVNAALSKSASISGVVTSDTDGLPLEDVYVQVDLVDPNGNSSYGGNTDVDGNFTVSGLPAGTYRMSFITSMANNSRTREHIREYYKDAVYQNDAALISLTAGQLATGYDASLAIGAKITGQVTAADGGLPIPDVWVEAYILNENGSRNYQSDTHTDEAGNYSLYGLPGGDYYVYFRPSDASDYIAESYNDKIYWKEGDVVTVPERTTVDNINASLETGRHIRGTLSSASTGLPITDWFYISVYDEDGDWRAYAYLDESGQYLSSALPPGRYTLYYNTYGMDPEIAQYLSEYYNDRPTRLTAKYLSVGMESDTIAENVSLDLAGSISGQVTSQTSSLGLGNVRIEYSSLNYRYYYGLSDSVYSQADGSYTIPYLEPGEYQLCFYPSGEYASTCITSVKVAIGSNVANVDAALESGGRISGQVTAVGTLVPLADVYVQIYGADGNFYTAAVTSITGDYISEPLPEGNYKVEFYPSTYGSTAAYIPEYYDNHTDIELADLVAVTAGSTTTGIDASLALGATISGRVTAAATGLPVEGERVTLYSIGDQYISYERYVTTNAEGYYTLAGIKNGSYKVGFENYSVGNLMNEWYNNQLSLDSADSIVITGMVDITGIDASLDIGGQISGTVTDNFGNPLEGASVYASVAGSEYYYYWGSTDADGFYLVNGLQTGSYEVTFEKYLYAREIYGGFDAPVPVSVTTGLVTPNIDMVLERGSVIAGWVNGIDTGEPEWADVSVFNGNGNEVVTFSAVNPKGYYELVLSPDKEYRFKFSPVYYSNTNYTFTYYQNKDSLETADAVWLPTNDVVYPVNGILPLGGSITGQVTSETDVPLQDVIVAVYDSSDIVAAMTITDSDGNFTTAGLGTGNYRVYFDTTYSEALAGYLPEYYADKTDLATADLVAVTAGVTTSGINAKLAELNLSTASFESNTQNVGEAVGSVSISLSLDAASPVAVSVPFTVGGYAAPGVDHTLQNGVFQFAPGETVDTLTFDVINDTLDELDETIILTLGDPINAQLGAISTYTITIMDDDLPIIVLPAPVVTQVTPSQGTAQTAATVVIYGSNFSSGAVATLKLEPASVSLSTTYQSDSQLYASVPAGLTEGAYSLEVTNPDGKTGTLANAYQVLPVITDDLFANTYDLWSDPGTVYSGTSVSIGLVVQRQGGQSVLETVSVDFYLGDPASDGVKIGSGSISNLAPGAWGSTSGLSWNAPTAGEYTLYAVIDPADAISETVESNNLISRKINVLAEPEPDADLTPPTVTSFIVNQGNPDTSSTSITYSVSASDNSGGIGVLSAMVIEYDFFESINQWVQVKTTDWLPYSSISIQNFELLETAGAKYLQVWVADGAGNVSLEPKTAFINYIPVTDSLLKGQSRYYVYSLGQAQEFTATVTPRWGDPDLYIWAPDFYSRTPWMSLSSTSPDSVTLISPVEGMYVVQIYGFSNSGFEFAAGEQSLTIAVAETVAVELLAIKEPLSEPGLQPGNTPSDQRGIEEAPQGVPDDEYYVFLPVVKK